MPAPLTGNALYDAGEGIPDAADLLGTIVATTTKNNHDTAVPFNNTGDALKGKTLLLQPDAVCYILAGTTSAATVTTSNGVRIGANDIKKIRMRSDQGWLACVSASGTTNIKVWALR